MCGQPASRSDCQSWRDSVEDEVWAWMSNPNSSAAEKDAVQNAISEIDKSSDRAAAIVASAFVEEHLAIALKARLHQDGELITTMFRSSGPLGSFSAKINLAFLIGFCSQKARKDLDTIREIRNVFAHNVLTTDFTSQRVRDLANNLTFGESHRITISPVDDDGKDMAPLVIFDQKPTTPRARFIRACQMFMFIFTMSKDSHPAPPKPEF